MGGMAELWIKEPLMFEVQYNDEMEAEVRRLEAKQRAVAAGHPEWDNACAACGCELSGDAERCDPCLGAGPEEARHA